MEGQGFEPLVQDTPQSGQGRGWMVGLVMLVMTALLWLLL